MRQLFHCNIDTLRKPWYSCYHYCTTSFNKVWTQILRRFKPCSQRVGDLRWRDPARGVSEICDGENLSQWSRLELKRKCFSPVIPRWRINLWWLKKIIYKAVFTEGKYLTPITLKGPQSPSRIFGNLSRFAVAYFEACYII